MRLKFLNYILAVMAAGIFYVQVYAQDSRSVLFNANWKFNKGDVTRGEKITLDDKAWRTLDLPHDWSIEGPFSDEWASGTGYLPAGIGWYRKTFSLTPEQLNKTIYLYFDGVYKNSEVWINEQYVGKRPNGYASFYYDITRHLNPKGTNVVAVKVDHTDFADSRWYSGSGINRNVYIVATEPVHTAIWGVAFTTPSVSAARADARVSVNVQNNSKSTADTRVVTELLDASGKVTATTETNVQVAAGKAADAVVNFTVAKPLLWSVEDPALYQLRITLYSKGKKMDVVTEQVGFRTFRFDADKGFFLNDKNIKLKGLCIHDDGGALGSAVPRDVWERRLKTFKEMGCNSIRMSHNPHQDYLYDLCDKLGLLVQDEAFDEWEVGKNKWIKGWNVGTPGKDGYNKDFKEWADRDVRDMILRNRNRTCIIMWSIGNEIDYPNDPYTHEVLNTGRNPQIYGKGYQAGNPLAGRLGEIATNLVQVVKQYDTTRPVTAALAGVVMSNMTTYPEALDIVGYNYQEYRYPDDHKQYPKRIIYGSENGKSYDAWAAVADNDYIAAQYLWTGIDFIGEARAWPVRASGAGLVDLAGFPKTEYYYRKSLWTSEPMVYLASVKISGERRRGGWAESHWNHTAGDSVNIVCYTNTTEAELFLNGTSLGRKKLSDASNKVIVWKTVYQPGELSVKGYNDGKVVANYSLKTAAKASQVSAVADHASITANTHSVAHVAIHVTDESGITIPAADNEVTISIDGPGKLIGLESGDLASHEDYKASKRKVYHGKLLAYIQGVKPGVVKITISSPGLKTSIVEITVK
ncbi:sugar-binding domain-containing protein [Ohtaekwangia kribbensis]|jgi:beta-galactosidase|uniref:Sugar-binding domain-containing protein n=1 Tax=Ohtaekwangia kribbensis TaxID=688913 RepID=A0ABW3K4A0_9BACT